MSQDECEREPDPFELQLSDEEEDAEAWFEQRRAEGNLAETTVGLPFGGGEESGQDSEEELEVEDHALKDGGESEASHGRVVALEAFAATGERYGVTHGGRMKRKRPSRLPWGWLTGPPTRADPTPVAGERGAGPTSLEDPATAWPLVHTGPGNSATVEGAGARLLGPAGPMVVTGMAALEVANGPRTLDEEPRRAPGMATYADALVHGMDSASEGPRTMSPLRQGTLAQAFLASMQDPSRVLTRFSGWDTGERYQLIRM